MVARLAQFSAMVNPPSHWWRKNKEGKKKPNFKMIFLLISNQYFIKINHVPHT